MQPNIQVGCYVYPLQSTSSSKYRNVCGRTAGQLVTASVWNRQAACPRNPWGHNQPGPPANMLPCHAWPSVHSMPHLCHAYAHSTTNSIPTMADNQITFFYLHAGRFVFKGSLLWGIWPQLRQSVTSQIQSANLIIKNELSKLTYGRQESPATSTSLRKKKEKKIHHSSRPASNLWAASSRFNQPHVSGSFVAQFELFYSFKLSR